MSLAPIITETCRKYFGHHVTSKYGPKRLVDNRCDACPLRAPCLVFGGAPAHTMEQLEKAREDFERAARELVG